MVLVLEDSQSAEGAALGPGGRRGFLAMREIDPQFLQPPQDRLAEMLFEPGLEVSRVVEGLERGNERAALAVEELPDELVEQDLLLQRLRGGHRVVETHQRLRRLAVDQQIWSAVLPAPFQGVLELEFRARLVAELSQISSRSSGEM